MDKKTIEEVIGRATTDAEFRKQLLTDPRNARTHAGSPIDETFLALLHPDRLRELDSSVHDYENLFMGGKTLPETVKSGSTPSDGPNGPASPGGPGGPMG